MAKKQKSGYYRTKVKIGVDADGRDMFKYVSGKTRAELEDNRRKAVEYFIMGTGLEDDRLFGDYATEWFRVRKEPFVSPSTRNAYRTMLNKHIFPAFGNRNLRAIRPIELQEFVNGFRGQSKSQITQAITTLQGIFSAAKQDRLIRDNPADSLTRPEATPPQERRALTDEERSRIIALFDTHPYGLYLAVLYYTGMRPGEVRGLQWGDFDWDAGLIHVLRDIDYATGAADVGALKTRAAERYIPIADDLRALLYPRRQAPGAFLFPGRDGRPLAQVTAVRMWIRLMADCGLAEPIPAGQKTCYRKSDLRGQFRPLITPYTMRHNFITMCWEKGLDILLTMKIVGHADYETTRNIYTHLSRKHLDNAKAELDAMFTAQNKSCTKVAQRSFRV